MGQNLIGALVRMLVLIITALVPATLGGVVGAVGHVLGLDLVASIALGTVLATATLLLEAWLLIVSSERRYDRFDITSEAITTDE